MIKVVGKGEDMSGQPSSLGSRGSVEEKKKRNQISTVLTKTATEKYLIPDGLGFSVTNHVSESIHLKSILLDSMILPM